jgi:hypothetical protein
MNAIRSECSDELETGYDTWMCDRPDMEWTIAELAAWAAIVSARDGTRGSNATAGKEV